MTTLDIYALVAPVASLMIGFGLGWYVKGRGLAGVKIDASNAANETKSVVAEVKAAV
jgi:hypothetical protein